MAAPAIIRVAAENCMQITKIKIKRNQKISKGSLICLYKAKDNKVQRFKSNDNGVIVNIFAKEGDTVEPGSVNTHS